MAKKRIIIPVKPTWTIPMRWEMAGRLRIQADTIEEALTIAEYEVGYPGYLPRGEYIEDSLVIERDEEVLDSYGDNLLNKEMNRINSSVREDLPLLIDELTCPEAQQYLEEKLKHE